VVTLASTADKLAAIVGPDAISAGSADHAVDGMEPAWVARPGSAKDAAAVVAWADDNRTVVIPLGGSHHAGRANLPGSYDVALDLRRLDRVVEFEPADLTITVDAGMTLDTLRKTTVEAGLAVPFDPGAPGGATVGGMIAAAVSGPSAMSLGSPRDFVIGMKVVTAGGQITKAGGKVVKNVSGYDLCKLYTGSLGTLGVIVEASLKVAPTPSAEDSLGWLLESAGEACSIADRAYRNGLNVRAALLVPVEQGWSLRLDLAGTAAGVERSRRELDRLSDGAPPAAAPQARRGPIVMRLGCPRSRLPALLTALRPAAGWLEGYPTLGICRLWAHDPSIEVINRAGVIAGAHGGSLVIEDCPPALKREIDVFGQSIPGLELMRRVKREWDPNGTLSPGRGPGRV
jgi:glycolate oxidase FAD binding subunit